MGFATLAFPNRLGPASTWRNWMTTIFAEAQRLIDCDVFTA
ncbi:MAG TPA: hypothetical protein VFU31_18900 [Candidatus Binatia bacterium]|nr:hypothetical protein [Candidatus Binatia bacterium]